MLAQILHGILGILLISKTETKTDSSLPHSHEIWEFL